MDYCSCSPLAYEISVDISKTCEGSTFELSNGVENATCYIKVDPEYSADKFPSPIRQSTIQSSYDFIEYGIDGREISSMRSTPFNHSRFDLVSISSIMSVNRINELPTSVQLNVYGTGPDNVKLVNRISFAYTNKCQPFSTFEEGQTMGWATIVSLRKTVAWLFCGFYLTPSVCVCVCVCVFIIFSLAFNRTT